MHMSSHLHVTMTIYNGLSTETKILFTVGVHYKIATLYRLAFMKLSMTWCSKTAFPGLLSLPLAVRKSDF